ncbi:amino acid ABC transporter ATP-binding protein [Nonomuraea guangzhouensis]|uniref:Amino acid ABC transporter ATP-binding protein n=1 Tax=Nonomuraea guangzhouensis TaxID=1291555 RepID=A0ABW4GKL5_9ACTN|nr:amino acid ABC transporter ATP-binding protein [Nonomuraea guangzhouensis]
MTTPEPIVSVRGLRKRFGDNEVLKGIDLDVRPGEVVVVMGPSGSGKTTLIRCLNLLEEPDTGTVSMCGNQVDCGGRGRSRAAQVREIRRRSAMVFQQFNLFPHLTALQNVMEGPISVRGLRRTEADGLGRRLLALVGLDEKCDCYPATLSGGQKQRVAIARALAMEPQVILFDEPTSALDPELHAEVLQVIRDLAGNGMTMVIVTHETAFARDVADRVVFMDGGNVIEEAPPQRFFTAPAHPRVQAFLRLVGPSHNGHPSPQNVERT